ncbi:Multi-sensor signal transduction histidine kinase [Hyphomicrobium sp. MC1]|nr:Multi-sensor signal transduction histidine kinase [Hyphomicrobium sp. MC1]
MAPFKITPTGMTRENARLSFAALCAVALLLFALLSIWATGPLRDLIFFGCGLFAAIAALFAWPRVTLDQKASDMTGIGSSSDKNLTWIDLAAAMPDPAIVLDEASVILNYNAAARGLFDRLRQGVPLEHVNRDPELISAVSNALQNGEKGTAHLVPRGGAGQRLIATVAPLGAAVERPPIAALITIHDESEQHRLLEMRTDFIANASHELRTPLASVRGFIETLQGPARNDEKARERFLAIMADQAERMTRLIDDLLLLSRVEEKANLKPEGRVDVNDLIEDVTRSLMPFAEERHITIEVEPSAGPLIAMGDRDELFQVFHNLVENAVKYGKEGGSVKVSLLKKNSARDEKFPARAHVSITDNGPGIAPEHLPRLTERFYRVSAEHSRRIGGTGLGLAIVKHVLNRHEAELSVQSVVGQGTTFNVSLPAYK